jgi:hypothetical protein
MRLWGALNIKQRGAGKTRSAHIILFPYSFCNSDFAPKPKLYGHFSWQIAVKTLDEI